MFSGLAFKETMKELNVQDATITGSSEHSSSSWFGFLAAVLDVKGHFNETCSQRTTEDLDVSKFDSVGGYFTDRPVFGQLSL